ncbi:DNA-binding protein [Halomonas korlensis]|uniref:Replication region DNA-binding N-term n=1 Tax=Halomonas korlensis TaxID=463301 RepID=A0A1I7EXC9_9GAMM|nr:DNA-binding protein [Halomonas korlensis]SFU28583.1 replication region DNA-binding N-term [Halomonas korlensis]
MARSGVRYEDVQQAIDQLVARRETPSVQKVREVLGTGSFTTISEHLREWRARREANRDLPAPRDMPEPLLALASALWEQAQQDAGEALSHYREEANQRIEAARAEILETQRHAEDAQQRESALAAHLAATEQRLEERSAELARSQSARFALEEREAEHSARLEKREEQLAQLQAKNERQAQRYQETLAAQESQQQQRLTQEEQRHESVEARLMTLLDEARQERQAAEKAHTARERQLETRLETLQQQLQAARTEVVEEERQRRESEWARTRAEDRTHALQHEQALLQARIDEQKRLLEDQARRLCDLEAQLNRRLWQTPVSARQDEAGNDEGSAEAKPSEKSEPDEN